MRPLLFAIASTALLTAAVPNVKLDTGIVSGAPGLKPDVRAYKGIPFAAPPTGNLRWRAPEPAAHWSGVRNGGRFAAICPQKTDDPRSIYFLDPGPQTISEDCLYLNVWTAARSASEKRPVMVWIFGGAFDHGSGTEKYYWGDDLAHKGAVVVTFDLPPFPGPVRHLKISRKYSVGIALRPHVRWLAAAGFVGQGRA